VLDRVRAEVVVGFGGYVALPAYDPPYAAADFAICRSGAMTCAELAAVGLPAACVPLPLRGGEQRLNAGRPSRPAGRCSSTTPASTRPGSRPP
jgi:UDP-N-acetylglucosamine--N-acetylmuramyl-(pentapeptide) pyrophosphoryl-undecaprenol N-acetylglucosamine transferase